MGYSSSSMAGLQLPQPPVAAETAPVAPTAPTVHLPPAMTPIQIIETPRPEPMPAAAVLVTPSPPPPSPPPQTPRRSPPGQYVISPRIPPEPPSSSPPLTPTTPTTPEPLMPPASPVPPSPIIQPQLPPQAVGISISSMQLAASQATQELSATTPPTVAIKPAETQQPTAIPLHLYSSLAQCHYLHKHHRLLKQFPRKLFRQYPVYCLRPQRQELKNTISGTHCWCKPSPPQTPSPLWKQFPRKLSLQYPVYCLRLQRQELKEYQLYPSLVQRHYLHKHHRLLKQFPRKLFLQYPVYCLRPQRQELKKYQRIHRRAAPSPPQTPSASVNLQYRIAP